MTRPYRYGLTSFSLRHRVTLQEPVETLDSQGNAVTTYQDRAEVWASVEPLTGRELLEAQQTWGAVATRIRVRYRKDVQKSWRVVWEGKPLQIQAVIDKDGAHRELWLMATEIQQ